MSGNSTPPPTRIYESLNEWAKECYDISASKGWWNEGFERSFGDICALIASEVSEAFEEYRSGHTVTETYYAHKNGEVCDPENPCSFAKPEGVPSELADVLIRVLDFCHGAGIDIDKAMREKMEYNKSREHRHGGKLP